MALSPEDSANRHPTRYLNDGASQHLSVDQDGRRPRLAFLTPSRRARFHARPHVEAREMPDDDYPSSSTPVAFRISGTP